MCEIHTVPSSVSEALTDSNWKKAMMDEYQALLKNNTWELVPAADNHHIVSNKWVYRVKYKADGTLDKYKARLVAKGFQQTAGVDFFETFSPVIKPSTIRVVFTLAVTHGWDIKQIRH